MKQSTISIAAASVLLILALLLGTGVYFVSGSIAREQHAVASQAESRQLGIDLANTTIGLGDAPLAKPSAEDARTFATHRRRAEWATLEEDAEYVSRAS